MEPTPQGGSLDKVKDFGIDQHHFVQLPSLTFSVQSKHKLGSLFKNRLVQPVLLIGQRQQPFHRSRKKVTGHPDQTGKQHFEKFSWCQQTSVKLCTCITGRVHVVVLVLWLIK